MPSEPTLGLEPRTYALRKHCSTAELSRQNRCFYLRRRRIGENSAERLQEKGLPVVGSSRVSR